MEDKEYLEKISSEVQKSINYLDLCTPSSLLKIPEIEPRWSSRVNIYDITKLVSDTETCQKIIKRRLKYTYSLEFLISSKKKPFNFLKRNFLSSVKVCRIFRLYFKEYTNTKMRLRVRAHLQRFFKTILETDECYVLDKLTKRPYLREFDNSLEDLRGLKRVEILGYCSGTGFSSGHLRMNLLRLQRIHVTKKLYFDLAVLAKLFDSRPAFYVEFLKSLNNIVSLSITTGHYSYKEKVIELGIWDKVKEFTVIQSAINNYDLLNMISEHPELFSSLQFIDIQAERVKEMPKENLKYLKNLTTLVELKLKVIVRAVAFNLRQFLDELSFPEKIKKVTFELFIATEMSDDVTRFLLEQGFGKSLLEYGSMTDFNFLLQTRRISENFYSFFLDIAGNLPLKIENIRLQYYAKDNMYAFNSDERLFAYLQQYSQLRKLRISSNILYSENEENVKSGTSLDHLEILELNMRNSPNKFLKEVSRNLRSLNLTITLNQADAISVLLGTLEAIKEMKGLRDLTITFTQLDPDLDIELEDKIVPAFYKIFDSLDKINSISIKLKGWVLTNPQLKMITSMARYKRSLTDFYFSANDVGCTKRGLFDTVRPIHDN